MRYDVSSHALLSLDAKALGSEAIRQQIELAEDLLKLMEIAEVTDPAQLDRVKRAVVRQVNWQVLMDPDALLLKSKTVGADSETYRDEIGLIDSGAKELLLTILPVDEEPPRGKWEPIVSKRS